MTAFACFFRKVTKAAPLIFTVTDRDDSLGTVSLPLAQIPSVAHRRRWMPLTTKNSQAIGDLCIDCWVLSFKKPSSVGEGVKWNSLLPFSLRTGSKERSKRRSSIEAASISIKGSRSIENLYSSLDLNPNLGRESNGPLKSGPSSPKLSPVVSPSGSATTLQPFTLFKPRLAPTLGQVLSSSNAPEITGLSPKSGPTSGGTRITVRGCNLGKSKEDICSISISGCDLLPTLEYHSPAKLVVVTKPWVGSGPVVLETTSGGRGTSTLIFTFQDKPAGETNAFLCIWSSLVIFVVHMVERDVDILSLHSDNVKEGQGDISTTKIHHINTKCHLQIVYPWFVSIPNHIIFDK